MNIIIKPSNKPDKNMQQLLIIKILHFGAAGVSEFTKHQDTERKQGYIKRQQKAENQSNPQTAGFMSRLILWERLTLKDAAGNVSRKFKKINVNLQV